MENFTSTLKKRDIEIRGCAYLDPPGGVGDSVGVGHHAQLARDPVLEGGGGPRGHWGLTVTISVRRLLASRLEVLRLELAGLGPFNFHLETFITLRTVVTGLASAIGPCCPRPWRWFLEAWSRHRHWRGSGPRLVRGQPWWAVTEGAGRERALGGPAHREVGAWPGGRGGGQGHRGASSASSAFRLVLGWSHQLWVLLCLDVRIQVYYQVPDVHLK